VKSNMVALIAALASSGLLLGLPAAGPARDEKPATLAMAWPTATRAALPATLPDGAAYQPLFFLDAATSVGTAPRKDQLRLLVRTEARVRVLRSLPGDGSFQAVTGSGTTLAWIENTGGGLALWTSDASGVRRVTTDVGKFRSYRSENDLVLADGQARWVAVDESGTTEVRSVALTGGPVSVRSLPGSWRLAGWPWLVDGVTDTRGAGALRNAETGEQRPVTRTAQAATDCSPEYCRVVSIDDDGWSRIELMRPDGSERSTIAEGDVNTAVVDVAPLGRFEIWVRIGTNSELTGNAELLVHEIATNRTVQISPDAGQITYRGGVLWWTAGSLSTFVRHSLDLRTIPGAP
jgi:hypothetical protein